MPPRDRNRRRPVRRAHAPRETAARGMEGGELELVQELRRGLRAENPADLLTLLSGVVEVGEPGGVPSGKPEVPLTVLVESFLDLPYAETTAALSVIAVLTRDGALAARIGTELPRRRHPLPVWLSALDDARPAGDVLRLVHLLGDGDDYLFGVRFADGSEITVVVYVDANLNGAVKDAFVLPDSLRAVSRQTIEIMDADQRLEVADAAGARALVEQAIAFGAAFDPPLESETWPAQRPLVSWVLGLFPGGGAPRDVEPVEEARLAALVEDFTAAAEGAAFRGRDARGVTELALRFAADYTGGDPLRWSPGNVEQLLAWVPGHVIADEEYLGRLPEVLEALVGYAHRLRSVPQALTRETVEAVRELTPGYRQLIAGDAREGDPVLDALRDRLGLDSVAELAELHPEELRAALAEVMPGQAFLTEMLAEQVGGPEALAALDAEPLPDEPFDWTGVPDDVQEAVGEWLGWCDRCADELFDIEHRTAFRRYLARVAASDPAVFRRRGSRVRGAAALVWSCARANGSVGWFGGLAVQDLFAWFGVGGSVTQRAEPLRRAIGADRLGEGLGAADLLVSDRRRQILDERDLLSDLRA